MIQKNIGLPGRLLRLALGLVCSVLAFVPAWELPRSAVLLVVAVVSFFQSAVSM